MRRTHEERPERGDEAAEGLDKPEIALRERKEGKGNVGQETRNREESIEVSDPVGVKAEFVLELISEDRLEVDKTCNREDELEIA